MLRKPQRERGFLLLLAVLYPVYVWGLYFLWYSNSPLSSFHLFNDFSEWLQMDKIGHFVVNFHSVLIPALVFSWAGFSPKKSAMYAFWLSFISLVPVEIMDGFSAAWGFSLGDMVANTAGSLFAYWQLRGFNKIIILPKFSYHVSDVSYALLRPDMFGSNYLQNSLKDYNGQTYWLTLDINALLGKKILPSWLLVSIGYSGEGMYGGEDNIWTDKTGVTHDYSHFARYRQFYLSLDFNFAPLIKNKLLQRILYPLNIFKVPFPAVEFSEMGLKWHWLYV
ncbi:MAG TPA: DUF2279 domain-containing protein [Bacteroidia bacterium]|nr:DUF2279 domain-containing protein [Bacteroidia bacterium]